MMLLNRERLELWMKATGKNQAWLARSMGYTRPYISLIFANRCKISGEFISRITQLTHIEFEDLFQIINEPDKREFFGSEIVFLNKMVKGRAYYEMLDRFKQKQIELNSLKLVDTERARV